MVSGNAFASYCKKLASVIYEIMYNEYIRINNLYRWLDIVKVIFDEGWFSYNWQSQSFHDSLFLFCVLWIHITLLCFAQMDCCSMMCTGLPPLNCQNMRGTSRYHCCHMKYQHSQPELCSHFKPGLQGTRVTSKKSMCKRSLIIYKAAGSYQTTIYCLEC